MYSVLQSGLLVSGNSYISLNKQVVSGDALSNLRVSGFTDLVLLKQGRSETEPLIGGTFTAVADYVEAEIYVHKSGIALSGVRRLIDDFKITVASGTWTNPARPYLVGEEWPLPQEKVSKGKLIYRFRYAL